jgi:hypothetical protein
VFVKQENKPFRAIFVVNTLTTYTLFIVIVSYLNSVIFVAMKRTMAGGN